MKSEKNCIKIIWEKGFGNWYTLFNASWVCDFSAANCGVTLTKSPTNKVDGTIFVALVGMGLIDVMVASIGVEVVTTPAASGVEIWGVTTWVLTVGWIAVNCWPRTTRMSFPSPVRRSIGFPAGEDIFRESFKDLKMSEKFLSSKRFQIVIKLNLRL